MQLRSRRHPPLHDQHRPLDLGLVAWLAGLRRHDGGAVMGGEVLIGPVDSWLVSAGGRDPGLEVVGEADRNR